MLVIAVPDTADAEVSTAVFLLDTVVVSEIFDNEVVFAEVSVSEAETGSLISGAEESGADTSLPEK